MGNKRTAGNLLKKSNTGRLRRFAQEVVPSDVVEEQQTMSYSQENVPVSIGTSGEDGTSQSAYNMKEKITNFFTTIRVAAKPYSKSKITSRTEVVVLVKAVIDVLLHKYDEGCEELQKEVVLLYGTGTNNTSAEQKKRSRVDTEKDCNQRRVRPRSEDVPSKFAKQRDGLPRYIVVSSDIFQKLSLNSKCDCGHMKNEISRSYTVGAAVNNIRKF